MELEAEDLSAGADDLGADHAVGSLDDTSYKLNRLRRDIEDESAYFYSEREDEIDSKLKRGEWSTEDAISSFDDFSSDLEDFDF